MQKQYEYDGKIFTHEELKITVLSIRKLKSI